MCRQFENFSRNCPETMFKSHFNEVIILQLFITLASNPNPTTHQTLIELLQSLKQTVIQLAIPLVNIHYLMLIKVTCLNKCIWTENSHR